jgi:glycosyltransferase involved in cell wall biosynthesis
MKILIIMGLSQRLVNSQVDPLTRLKKVKEIIILRNDPGPGLKKVIYIHPFKFSRKISIGKIFFKILKSLKIIRTSNPAIIISFYLVPHGIISFFCAKITRKPVCLSLLGTDLNIHCRKKVFGNILIWILKNSDIITVPGTISQQFLIEKGIPKSKIYILPNTIDNQEFHPIIIPKKYDVISIGRLMEGKHLEILLNIISKIKQDFPTIKVGIAGTGPLSKELKHKSIELELKNNVKFLGYVEDAPQFLNSGKIYVLTSESEGLPTAMIEAMACGIPSVVSNVGNIKDVAVNGENCFVINDYRDVNSYIKAISKLLNDEKLYEKISKNALKVRNKYSVSNASDIWKNIFRKLQLS